MRATRLFSQAVEKFRRHPRQVTREALQGTLSAEDDPAVYGKVKASMIE